MSDDSSRTVPRAPDMAYRVAPAAVAGLLWVLGPADGAHETVVTAGPRALLAGPPGRVHMTFAWIAKGCIELQL